MRQGVIKALEIQESGYPAKYKYADFLEDYNYKIFTEKVYWQQLAGWRAVWLVGALRGGLSGVWQIDWCVVGFRSKWCVHWQQVWDLGRWSRQC